MLQLKKEAPADPELSKYSPPGAQAELDYWERLVFSFDMDRDPDPNAQPRNTRGSRPSQRVAAPATASHDDASQIEKLSNHDRDALAQFAAVNAFSQSTAGMAHNPYEMLAQSLRGSGIQPSQGGNLYLPPNPYLPQAYMGQSQGHMNYSSHQPSNYGAWPHQVPQQPLQGHFNPVQQQYSPPTMQMPYGTSSHHQLPHIATMTPTTSSSSSNPSTRTSAPTSRGGTAVSEGVSSPEQADQGSDEPASVTEDKRRRNTVASARFRIKKKQRSINLERSVSDLTGRAEELEREATELRRENGWLKEIVMLKGRSLQQNRAYQEGDEASDSQESEESEEEEAAKTKRGKGKAKK
ncbi:hypothetical protein HWV62_8531 [Athelia sp. TMB]|nr:hypothetical protein HWV62_8531 [Athelia sp. TMB]